MVDSKIEMSPVFKEFEEELNNTLNYWESHALDNNNAGFIGQINFKNKKIEKAPKGLILNTRILWSFAAVSNHLKTTQYTASCNRAYHYLALFFRDKSDKGLYWELANNAKPESIQKNTVGQAYALLALCEYFLFSKKSEVKDWAVSLFEYIESFGFDTQHNYYIDALKEKQARDVKASEVTKSLGTHLHLLEAYTAMLKFYDNDRLKEQIRLLIELLLNDFINENKHCETAIDAYGNSLSVRMFYGYNVEVPWMLFEAAEAIANKDLITRTKDNLVHMVDVFLQEAIDENGAVRYSKCLESNIVDTDLHWWTQIEALIAIRYAYYFTQNEDYLISFHRIWDFIKEHFMDKEHGEWFARLKMDTTRCEDDKIAMWKSPYHISRMCLKIMALEYANPAL